MKNINFTFLLAILMSMVGSHAFAYTAKIDGIYYYLSSGNATVTYYNIETSTNADAYKGDIVIPESVTYNGSTYSVTSISSSAFKGCSGLTSVNIPSSVTSIGGSAFNGCSGLTSVNIPSSVTSIGGSAFNGCSGLTSVNIPNSVTSIGDWAFCNCSGLTSVNIPNSVTSIGDWAFSGCSSLTSVSISNSVTSIGDYMFYNCSGLTSITIPNSVTSISSSAFRGCSGLTSITIPNSVTSIGDNVFYNCSGLTSVNIPNSVTSIGDYAFYNCSGLTSVNIPSSVTSIGGSAFNGCSGLTSVNIPNNVTSIGDWAFYNCSGLTSVNIPNNVTSIGDYAFDGCSGLTSITIPNSVTSIGGWAFYGCSSLTSVSISNSVTSISDYVFYNCSGLTSITIPNSVTSIGSSAFRGCSGLTSITIPNSVTSIGDYVFYNCSGLTSITIPNSVTSIGDYVFYNCSGLTSITIPNSVTSIGGSAFSGCGRLTSINVPVTDFTAFCNNKIIGLLSLLSKPVSLIDKEGNEIKEYVIPEDVTGIGEKAFYNCSGLTSVTIPNSVTTIESSAFSFCNNLTNVTINSNSIVSANRTSSTSLKTIFGDQVINYVFGENVTSIGDYAFYNCSGLTSITIPSSVTSIGSYAFYNCSNLTNVKVPVTDLSTFCNNNVVGLIASQIGKSVWLIDKDGNEIKEYVIPEDVTSIGNSAFFNCSGLTSITIPNSVTSIGTNAFQNCSGLTKVIVSDIESWCGIAFGNAFANPLYYAKHIYDDNDQEITEIIVPEGLISLSEFVFVNCENITKVTLNSKELVAATYTTSSNLGTMFGSGVKDFILGDAITSIGQYAFYSNSATITVGDNIAKVEYYALTGKKIFANNNTKSVLALWTYGTDVHQIGGNYYIGKPQFSLKKATQTTISVSFSGWWSAYTYTLDGETYDGHNINKTGLRPEASVSVGTLSVSLDDVSYNTNTYFETTKISPSVKSTESTASSSIIEGTHIEGDATIVSERIIVNGKTYEGATKKVTGLNPNTTYSMRYEVEVAWGENNENTYTYDTKYKQGYSYKDRTFTTAGLTLTTSQPKVVSLGNVIVSAESNIDDEEKNVGFEWRRTDWTDDFQSNTGTANMFEGTMEGYIRNLNTEKLWKFRPYYLADDGTYYYGDWVGLDPTNTSYFEPTVHTYAKIEVKGNTALVKGYALDGSDKITVQGFKYWKKASANNRAASDIPSDAMTIEAKGTVMEVSLTDLEYASSYEYVAFATTSEGDTFYGEIKTFETGESPVTPGDANGDGVVNVTDIVEIVNDILGHPSAKFDKTAADVNGDGVVNVTDIVSVVNIILSSNARELTNRAAATNNLKLNGGSIKLRNAENYTAAQFDIHLTDGSTINYLSLNSASDHQMTWKMVDANTCRVIVYSLSNAPFRTAKDELFNVTLSGNATISNELLVNVDGMVTGINEMQFDKPVDVYDLRGNKVRSNTTDLNGLQKGVYIVNGKKVVVK